jgi:twinkle protein
MSIYINEKDFDQYAEFLGHQESQEIRNPSAFLDQVEQMATHGDIQQGDDLPWEKASEIWKIRPAELTIWAGVNGHGKSLLQGQVMLNAMKSQRVVIASLEMLPKQTLYRMACQFAGCRPDPKFARRVVESMDGRLWLYDQQDTVSPLRMLAMVLYCAKELKADHVVIDSLLKCGIAEDDYKGQKNFVDRLQWLAKSNGIHIHLVCHMRKKENETHQTGKLDIRGTSAITDLADNVIIVRRNKEKEKVREKQELGVDITAHEAKYLEQWDAYMTVEKNRHGQAEGTIGLSFNANSMQYGSRNTHQAMPAPWKLNMERVA